MQDGMVLIDKPAGMTSFGVVARVRRVLSQQAGKKIKVGHTGTLDPFATGLMIIVVGRECKNAQAYSKLDKTYEATLRLGETSSTGDPEGELTKISEMQPSSQALDDALAQHTGNITQRPPAFSAIKINGQRAYDLARKGEQVEMPTRQVTISRLTRTAYAYPEVQITTDVSSGTYIRSLAEAIGRTLGTGAYCSQLRRTRVGDYHVEDAVPLETFMVQSGQYKQ